MKTRHQLLFFYSEVVGQWGVGNIRMGSVVLFSFIIIIFFFYLFSSFLVVTMNVERPFKISTEERKNQQILPVSLSQITWWRYFSLYWKMATWHMFKSSENYNLWYTNFVDYTIKNACVNSFWLKSKMTSTAKWKESWWHDSIALYGIINATQRWTVLKVWRWI